MALNKIRNVAFLSTYPPRECGLATFTQDLVRELDKIKLLNTPKIIAVSDNKYNYSERVILELVQHDRQSYNSTAEAINNSDTELLVIEHEYGIFGGNQESTFLILLRNCKYRLLLHFILCFLILLPCRRKY